MKYYDIVYRYCDPSVLSGDGRIERSRYNGELIFSLKSLELLNPYPSDIFIVYKGQPPNIDKNRLPEYIFEKITFYEESTLFNAFYNEYKIPAMSFNSEPCKMCFQYLSKLKWGYQKSTYFISMDDDYIIRRNISLLDIFLNKEELPIYPLKIKNSHCPLIFLYSDYSDFIHNMSDEEKKKYIQSYKNRLDIYQVFIPSIISTNKAVSKNINKSFIGYRSTGLIQLIILIFYFAYVDLTDKKFVCINDNWDKKKVWYKINISIYHKWVKSQKNKYVFLIPCILIVLIFILLLILLCFIVVITIKAFKI